MKLPLDMILSYQQQQLLSSSMKRVLRWEFWPAWLLYIPVVFYILWLIIRFRGLTFTAVNPGMPGSGFIGENKSLSLGQLQSAASDLVAKTAVISCEKSLDEQHLDCLSFMSDQQLSFPIIAKPDFGQRGVDVSLLKNESELTDYLSLAEFDTVLQEYIAGVEFGVFYTRDPYSSQGSIFSITHKCFPEIVGDGTSTIEALIFKHERLSYMSKFLLKQHKTRLNEVPDVGAIVHLVQLGSHCRGALFLDGKHYYSTELMDVINKASHQLEGFYFGRYDIRAESIDAFKRGKIKIIEVNGVTSESTDIYDPKNSLFFAYKTLFKQWRLAFQIGKKNTLSGYPAMTISDLIHKVKIMNHGIQ